MYQIFKNTLRKKKKNPKSNKSGDKHNKAINVTSDTGNKATKFKSDKRHRLGDINPQDFA